jgi:PAS domain S-box-containing protein
VTEEGVRKHLIAYGGALAIMAAALLVRLPLSVILDGRRPYLTLFGGIALAVWFARWKPAAVAAVAGFIAAHYFLAEPITPPAFSAFFIVEFLTFSFSAALIIFFGEAMHRARESTRRNFELVRITLASIGDGVIVTDANGDVQSLNAEAERLTGWRTAEVAGQPLANIFRIVNEETGKPVENPVEKVLRSGSVIGLANHTVLIARDGTTIPIDDSAAPIRDGDGPIFGTVLVFRDVSEQRASHNAKARLAAIVENSEDVIITKDLNSIVQTWNAAAEQLFGYRAEEMIGKPVTLLIPSDRINEEAEITERLRRGERSELVETVRVSKDGREIPVMVRVSPLRNTDGDVIGASTIVHDFTDIVAAREELAQEKELLATTLASIGDAVITTDTEGRVTYLNRVAEAVTGWTQSDAVGHGLETVFHIVNEQTRRTVESPAARALREGTIVGLANHTVLIRKDGTECPIDDSAAPIRNRKGQVTGCVLVFRDITERRHAEIALSSADQRKNEFLATLAHELRNPLAPILNSVRIMKLARDDRTAVDGALGTMERQVGQMARLVDDLMDLARINRGKIELRREQVELASVLRQAVEICRPLAETLGHTIEIDIPRQPIYLHADPVRLAQIFSNILNNACKYTKPRGRIWLTAEKKGSEASISIRDEGVGIAAEMLPLIFEMFTQADQTLERTEGGLGVGLTLVKQLVEMHGGTVAASSDGPGKGTEFVVRLPVSAETVRATATAVPQTPPAFVGRRILVVDDNQDSAESLAILLKITGHETQLAYDGLEAVQAAEKFRPDIVLLDIGLPRLNGLEACRRIREQEWADRTILVALTGWGQEDDRQRSKEAGFDHHLVKPVDFVALLNLLASLPTSASQ